MKKSILLITLALLVSPLRAGPITIVPQKVEDGRIVAFSLQNPKAYPITVTLEVTDTENLGPAAPVTTTLHPGDTVEALRLAVLQPGAPGKWRYLCHWTSGAAGAVPDLSHEYRLPYAPGTAYKVIQSFNGSFSHSGEHQFSVDWEMPEGTPVYAARGGRVMNVQDEFGETGGRELFDKANYVRILHSDGTVGVYLHLQQGGVIVNENDAVEEGTLLGFSGNTGFSSEPHLHFGVYRVIDGVTQESVPVLFRSGSQNGLALTSGQIYQN